MDIICECVSSVTLKTSRKFVKSVLVTQYQQFHDYIKKKKSTSNFFFC